MVFMLHLKSAWCQTEPALEMMLIMYKEFLVGIESIWDRMCKGGQQGGLALSTLILAMTIGWIVLAQQNFLYGVWHDHAGIGEGIEKYGSKNRFKQGFADTDREQRVQLFAEINTAIHHHGKGLADIVYQSVSSGGPQVLLRVPEQVHLQDVANLIDVLHIAVSINFLIWCGLAIFVWRRRRASVNIKHQFAGLIIVVLATLIILAVFGADNVFNQLHIWVFPEGNAWFFYYQDSLMSTMMLAPYLFAWIAGTLALYSIVVFFVLTRILITLSKKRY